MARRVTLTSPSPHLRPFGEKQETALALVLARQITSGTAGGKVLVDQVEFSKADLI